MVTGKARDKPSMVVPALTNNKGAHYCRKYRMTLKKKLHATSTLSDFIHIEKLFQFFVGHYITFFHHAAAGLCSNSWKTLSYFEYFERFYQQIFFLLFSNIV